MKKGYVCAKEFELAAIMHIFMREPVKHHPWCDGHCELLEIELNPKKLEKTEGEKEWQKKNLQL